MKRFLNRNNKTKEEKKSDILFDNVKCDKIVRDIYSTVQDKIVTGVYIKQTCLYSVLKNIELFDGTEYIFEYHGASFNIKSVTKKKANSIIFKNEYDGEGNILNGTAEEIDSQMDVDKELLNEYYKKYKAELIYSYTEEKYYMKSDSFYYKKKNEDKSITICPLYTKKYTNPNMALQEFKSMLKSADEIYYLNQNYEYDQNISKFTLHSK